MRALLAQADLARYAGQFVWLDLNFDKPENLAFLTKFGANATPTFFVISPYDEQVVATQTGAMSFAELTQFLDRGAASAISKTQTPGDEALMRGDALLAQQPAEAAKAYHESLLLAPPAWARRELAEASFVGALRDSRQYQQCGETAVAEASSMNRDSMFARTVVAGMWCVVSVDPAPWSDGAAAKLIPLAEEALTLPTTVRDHRDEIYRTLMYNAVNHGNSADAAKWGNRWLAELDRIKPANDEERSAIDIARVENIQVFGDPRRILPALIASERAMPRNYNASLRLAQMQLSAQHYREGIAACDRGLARDPGALGRSWLLYTKAQGLTQEGRTAEAQNALENALPAARAIPNEESRRMNITMIEKALAKSKNGAAK